MNRVLIELRRYAILLSVFWLVGVPVYWLWPREPVTVYQADGVTPGGKPTFILKTGTFSPGDPIVVDTLPMQRLYSGRASFRPIILCGDDVNGFIQFDLVGPAFTDLVVPIDETPITVQNFYLGDIPSTVTTTLEEYALSSITCRVASVGSYDLILPPGLPFRTRRTFYSAPFELVP